MKHPQNYLLILAPMLTLGIAACGDDKKSPGDQAKAATDAVVKKADEVKDVVTDKQTRADVEKSLDQQITELKLKLADLEAKESKETVAEIKAANKTRMDSVKASLSKANDQFAELKKSAETEWKAKRDATIAAMDAAKAKVTSALDRQKLKEEVNAKLEKIQLKIDELADRAAKANAEEKQKLEESKAKLETKFTELKADYNKFVRSTEEKWDNFKEGFSKAFKELSDAFKGLFD